MPLHSMSGRVRLAHRCIPNDGSKTKGLWGSAKSMFLGLLSRGGHRLTSMATHRSDPNSAPQNRAEAPARSRSVHHLPPLKVLASSEEKRSLCSLQRS